MKIWCLRLTVLAAMVAFGWWAWTLVFPPPEKVIRKHLLQLARDASFNSGEGELARVDNASRVAAQFSEDSKVVVDVPRYSRSIISSREDIFKAVMASRSGIAGLKIDFPDVVVRMGPDKDSATVSVTANATIVGDREAFVQELRFSMKKIGGKWLIYRVETVKTLTRGSPVPLASDRQMRPC